MWDKIVKAACALGGAIAGLFGGWNQMLTVLACFMVIDYVSGLIVAFAGKSPKTSEGGVSSEIGFKGLLKKAVILLIVVLATLLDRITGDGAVFQMATVAYYIANEGISILENAVLMGIPVPRKLEDALEVLREEPEDE